MQAGFALLSAGSVRMRSVKNILLKSVMDACFGGLVWCPRAGAVSAGPSRARSAQPAAVRYLIGFGFAYDKSEDGNAFIGGSGHNFALSGADDTTGKKDYGHDAVFFFFQYCFAAAAATITSGAVAERCTLVGYCAYVFAIVGFVYPTVVHWRAQLPRGASIDSLRLAPHLQRRAYYAPSPGASPGEGEQTPGGVADV